jgi:hypothetical protein
MKDCDETSHKLDGDIPEENLFCYIHTLIQLRLVVSPAGGGYYYGSMMTGKQAAALVDWLAHGEVRTASEGAHFA